MCGVSLMKSGAHYQSLVMSLSVDFVCNTMYESLGVVFSHKPLLDSSRKGKST